MHVETHTHSTLQIPSDAVAHARVAEGAYALYFESLFRTGRGFAFPCDSYGRVNLDAMTERVRNNYYYARAMIGREVSWPSVRRLLGTRDSFSTSGDPGYRSPDHCVPKPAFWAAQSAPGQVLHANLAQHAGERQQAAQSASD